MKKTASEIISDNLPFVIRTSHGFYWSTASDGIDMIDKFLDVYPYHPRDDWVDKYFGAVARAYLGSHPDCRLINCSPVDSDDFYEWCTTRPHLVRDYRTHEIPDCSIVRKFLECLELDEMLDSDDEDFSWCGEDFSTIKNRKNAPKPTN